MAALTQPRAWGAMTGGRYGSFDGRTVIIPGPYYMAEAAAYSPGSRESAAYAAGAKDGAIYIPGLREGRGT